jgi:hypothetical protein
LQANNRAREAGLPANDWGRQRGSNALPFAINLLTLPSRLDGLAVELE